MRVIDKEGYWGEITANYDWCEVNYNVTEYVAEFFNAMSSITIVLAGVYFYSLSCKYTYGLRFKIAGAITSVVGVGSMAFHGTLQRWGQVLDEVPMLWSAAIFLYICIMSLYWSKEQEDLYGGRLSYLMLAFCTIVTSIYFLDGGFPFFILTYLAMVIMISVLSLNKAGSSKYGRFAFYAIGFYVGGSLFLWVPEQAFCGNRLEVSHDHGLRALPIPLHSFFHVTSAIGPVCFLTFTVAEELEKLGRKPFIEWRRHWASLFVKAPVCVPGKE